MSPNCSFITWVEIGEYSFLNDEDRIFPDTFYYEFTCTSCYEIYIIQFSSGHRRIGMQGNVYDFHIYAYELREDSGVGDRRSNLP